MPQTLSSQDIQTLKAAANADGDNWSDQDIAAAPSSDDAVEIMRQIAARIRALGG